MSRVRWQSMVFGLLDTQSGFSHTCVPAYRYILKTYVCFQYSNTGSITLKWPSVGSSTMQRKWTYTYSKGICIHTVIRTQNFVSTRNHRVCALSIVVMAHKGFKCCMTNTTTSRHNTHEAAAFECLNGVRVTFFPAHNNNCHFCVLVATKGAHYLSTLSFLRPTEVMLPIESSSEVDLY